MKNCFNELNCGRRSLKDEVRENHPKTAVVPQHKKRLYLVENGINVDIHLCSSDDIESAIEHFNLIVQNSPIIITNSNKTSKEAIVGRARL